VGGAVVLHILTAFQGSPKCLKLVTSLGTVSKSHSNICLPGMCHILGKHGQEKGLLWFSKCHSQVCSLKASREKILWCGQYSIDMVNEMVS
jgi:hypothetical protein